MERTQDDNSNEKEKTIQRVDKTAGWLYESDGRRMLSGNFLSVILVAAPPSEAVIWNRASVFEGEFDASKEKNHA